MEAFSRFLGGCAEREIMYSMDEAVFTCAQISPKLWFPKQESEIVIDKKKLTFKAVAVAAAIDSTGAVVAHHIVDGAINKFSFCDFLEEVAGTADGRKICMLVDNLPVHHTKIVQKKASELNIELIFNGTYSSEFNAIERLWAWSKRTFERLAIDVGRYDKQQQIRKLVREAILTDYRPGLRKHWQTCLRRMEDWLAENSPSII